MRDVYDIIMIYVNLWQVFFCWVIMYFNYYYFVFKLIKFCEKFSLFLNLNVYVYKFLYVNDKIFFVYIYIFMNSNYFVDYKKFCIKIVFVYF